MTQTVLDYRTSSAEESAPTSRIEGHWLAWAIYLGMSWTWCIGMFLPVLIMRDFGIPGWIIFAVPNVVGAAAMGWVLRSSQSAQSIAFQHQHASAAFSIITIAFHVFCVTWIGLPILGERYMVLAPILVVGFVLVIRHSEKTPVRLAWAAFALGCVTLVYGLYAKEFPYFYGVQNQSDSLGFAALIGVCLFGFSLCPYLDRTFLRARRRTSVFGARAAFTLGFGLFFLVMILLTLNYAGWMNRSTGFWFRPFSFGAFPPVVWTLVGLYFLTQCAYTIGVHWATIEQEGAPLAVALTFAALCCVLLLIQFRYRFLEPLGGEVLYRLFMAFYGLIFPAYVWLCMIPGRGRVAPNRRQLVVLAISVLIAAPMFWMGFIERQMVWLLPGLAVVLLARLFVPRVSVPQSVPGTSPDFH